MKTEITVAAYKKYLDDISEIYEQARSTIVRAYWKIGKHIYEIEQKHGKESYGRSIIQRLSEELTKKYGSGFSISNLTHMREFYLAYAITQPVGKLEWSKYVVLLTVKDEEKRREFERMALKENLTRDRLRRIIQNYNRSIQIEGNEEREELPLSRGKLYTYRLVGEERMAATGGEVMVDCGFNVWRSVHAEGAGEIDRQKMVRTTKKRGRYYLEEAGNDKKMLYTYRSTIEKVIDGDTLWAVIDLGFDTWTRQKLRLRGIDAPEPHTGEGRRAKGYLERKFRENPEVVIKTYRSDKYDRYLTDIFYLTEEADGTRIAMEGVFLNQELLDRGLVRRF